MTARISAIVAALACVAALAAPAPLRADPASGRTIDGIRCDQAEGANFHIHQHITLLDHGKNELVPSDIGRPLSGTCLYWLHTHSPDGMIHVESPTIRSFNLGQFFDIWGQPLSPTRANSLHAQKGTQLRFYVNGMRYSGDPRKIELVQHADIVIESGPPFSVPKPFAGWGSL